MPPLTRGKLALWAAIGAIWVSGRARLQQAGSTLTSLTIPLGGLPKGHPGISLLLLSDLHVASTDSPALHVLDELAGLAPDLLCIGGDIVDAGQWMPEVTERLAAIQPRHGAFAVWGNHDVFRSTRLPKPPWVPLQAQPLSFMQDALTAAGIRLLTNDSATVTVHGLELQVVGIGDTTSYMHDLDRAFRATNEHVFTLVISHNPDVAFELGSRRADLVLCGHTHGGQIVPPLARALHTGTRWRLPRSHGLMHIGGRPVYISRGIGTVLIPIRLNASSQTTMLQLIPPSP